MDKLERLDRIFYALSDSKRRGMLELLLEGEKSVGQLGEPYGLTKQAVSKHLKVLENSGFISKSKDGRIRRCQINPKPLIEANSFIQKYHQFWEHQFDALEEYIESINKKGEQE